MASRSFLGSILGAFGDIERARRTQSAYRRMAQMSDRELARRGLTRSDLPRLAFREGFGEL